MRSKSFTRSLACLTFSLLFLLTAFARPALAQSDLAQNASSQLKVDKNSLSFSVNLNNGANERDDMKYSFAISM